MDLDRNAMSHRQYWLMKSEPSEVSIEDLARAPSQTVPWTGVRNYQARNFMRDLMKPGDGVLFRPDLQVHAVSEVVVGERLVWSVGCWKAAEAHEDADPGVE
jgi:hypothetical protein